MPKETSFMRTLYGQRQYATGQPLCITIIYIYFRMRDSASLYLWSEEVSPKFLEAILWLTIIMDV